MSDTNGSFEIEVKFRVRNVEDAVPVLSRLGCVISDPVTQRDEIFAARREDIVEPHPGTIVLRIRHTEAGSVFTFKKHRSHELDCLEYETAITNPVAFASALGELGYAKHLEVVKTRRHARLGKYTICLDRVSTLGDFIEVESISDSDPEAEEVRLLSFIDSIGIELIGREFRGYDRITLESHGG